MENTILSKNVKEEVLNAIKKCDNSHEQEKLIKEVKSKFKSLDLFCNEPITQKYRKVLCMYHELNVDELLNCFNISGLYNDSYDEDFGISSDSKILLEKQYNMNYKDSRFDLFVIYEFEALKIESANFFIEPWLFVESKVEFSLVLEDKVIFRKKKTFDISSNKYLEKVSDFEFCIKPQKKEILYKIVDGENSSSHIKKSRGDFSEVVKNILNILLEDIDSINVNKDLTIETSKTNRILEYEDVTSDLFYEYVKIGQIAKSDTLYEYEVTFKIEGISKYVKVYVYLTDNEYKRFDKIENFIVSDSSIKSVPVKESVYTASNDVYMLKKLYFSKSSIVKVYIERQKKSKNSINCDEIRNILSDGIISKPTIIDISNKGLPFSKVILYKNILREKSCKEPSSVKIFDIQEEKLICEKENSYIIISKYIVITENGAYEVELASNIKQGGVYSDFGLEINLPVLFSKEVMANYRKIQSEDMINDIAYSTVYNKSQKDKDCLGYVSMTIKTAYIQMDINRNFKKYFDNVLIDFGKRNIKDSLEKTLKCAVNLDMYDLILSNKKIQKKRISIVKKLTLSDDYEDFLETIKVDVYTKGYYLGKAGFEKDNPLILGIGDDDNSLEELAEVNISEAYFGGVRDLYTFFLSIKTNLNCKEIDRNDKLTNAYIDAMLDEYNLK